MPRIVALIGIDGTGKSTQARLLAERLAATGVPVTRWRNAGGRRSLGTLAPRLGRRDGDDLLGTRGMFAVEFALRWLAIARALVCTWLLGPRRVAVMDRYSYCQYASARSHAVPGERITRRLYRPFPTPDVVLHLTVAPQEAYRRIEVRARDHEELAYLEASDRAYRSLPEADQFVTIDASRPAEEVHARIWSVVQSALGSTCAAVAALVGALTSGFADLAGELALRVTG